MEWRKGYCEGCFNCVGDVHTLKLLGAVIALMWSSAEVLRHAHSASACYDLSL
jgi:hypothetical protein